MPVEANAHVAWYQPELREGQIPLASYELLENYSHIPRNDIDTHVANIREKAWSIFPYPCIGQWRFLDLSISQQPAYPKVLSLLKEGDLGKNDENDVGKGDGKRRKLLDLGCCFAQDIRKLIHDGAPADSLYACDLKPEFLDLGYELFADRESCKAHFFAADVLRDDEGYKSGLAKLAGEFDFVHAASFFHIFSWDDQVQIGKRVVQLLRPRKGSTVFGRQTGNVRGGGGGEDSTHKDPDKAPIWRHDVDSLKRLWEIVGQLTGSKWEVWAKLYETTHTARHWSGEGVRMLRFEVTRIE